MATRSRPPSEGPLPAAPPRSAPSTTPNDAPAPSAASAATADTTEPRRVVPKVTPVTEIKLCVIVRFHQPPGADAQARERLWRLGLEPWIGLVHHTAGVRAGFVLSGDVVEDLVEVHPEGVEWIRDLSAKGQIELVGTAQYEPLLGCVPERDAVAQVEAHASVVKRTFGVRPTGLWLPQRWWDPTVPRVAGRAGMTWSTIEDRWVDPEAAELGPAALRTERDGYPLWLLAIDTRIGELARVRPVAEAVQHIERAAQQGRGAVVIPLDADDRGLRGLDGPSWMAELLNGLRTVGRSAQMVLPSSFFARPAPAVRTYLPAAGPRGASVPWERSLAREPLCDRIHKRSLLLSRQLAELETRTATEASETRPDPQVVALSVRRLHRAQGCLFADLGRAAATDGAVRARAWRELLLASRAFDEATGRDPTAAELVDLDADGVPEVLLGVPERTFVIDATHGGALSEASFVSQGINLVHVAGRFAPPPPPARGRRAAVRPRPEAALAREGFALHVLPDPFTFDDWRADRLAAAPRQRWEVESVGRRAEGTCRATLSGELVVPGAGAALRVTRTYTLRRSGMLECRIEVLNRAHEGVRARLALELPLPPVFDTLVRMHPAGDPEIGRLGPCDLVDVSRLGFLGQSGGVELTFERPSRVWVAPIYAAVEASDDEAASRGAAEDAPSRSPAEILAGRQGHVALLIWSLELWGKEKSRLGFTLDVPR